MQAQAMIYNVLIQTVLLYRSESWVVMDVMMRVLEGFHHQVSQRISGMSYWKFGVGVGVGDGMGVVIGGGGLGGVRDVANEGVHLEASGYHSRIYR